MTFLSGLTAVAGPCDAGYYCPESSRQRDELECPMGFWCPVQTHYPQQCENGTFSNATGRIFNMAFINISHRLCVKQTEQHCCVIMAGLTMASQCRPCNPGEYCNGFGLIEPTGDCQAGK